MINSIQYKPSGSSFWGSVAFALSPAATAGITTYFIWEKAPIALLIAGAVMAALSLLLVLQAMFVHSQSLYIDEQVFMVKGPLSQKQIRWSQITSAVLKERENAMTRTDHLLILRSADSVAEFNTSTLSERDEALLLDFVRQKVNLVVEQSKPSI